MKCFILFSQLFLVIQLSATDFYVSALTGNNANDGLSETTALLTIQTAADLTLPGDVVYVMDGTYVTPFTDGDVVYISRSGTAAAWITYTNLPGHAPKLEFNGWQGFKIEGGVSYIEISGFEIEGNNANIMLNAALNQPAGCNDPGGNVEGFYNGNGITSDGRYQGRNHHISVRNCTIYNCAGAGIAMIQSDYITVENCNIYNNAWYSIYANSGLTLYQLWNADGTTGTHNVIRNNFIANNEMRVPWPDFNCEFTDGNGIIIDDSRNTQNGSPLGVYTARTLIENNVVNENGGRGIHVFESDHVDIRNNTTYQNGSTPEIADGEITAIFASDVMVTNNIMVARAGEPVNKVNGTNIEYDYNLNFNSTIFDIQGPNSINGQDPLFTDPAMGNWALQPGSPAIDVGTAAAGLYATTDLYGQPRPQGAAPDMGALEAPAAALPVVYARPLRAELTAHKKVELSWRTAAEVGHAYFDIEHATDGRAFSALGQVAAGGDNSDYEYVHPDPRAGMNYYRLRQVDLDGSIAYSPVVTVEVAEETAPELFPNPTPDGRVMLRGKTPAVLQVYSADGRLLRRVAAPNFPLLLLPNGMGIYLLRGLDETGREVFSEWVRRK